LEAFDQLKEDLDKQLYINSVDNFVQLKNEHLPKVANYSFSRKIANAIPELKNKLINFALSEARSFLSEARKDEILIGDSAFDIV
ncbi:MAG: Exocyst complex component 6, partial [Paramarteilia canceri]